MAEQLTVLGIQLLSVTTWNSCTFCGTPCKLLLLAEWKTSSHKLLCSNTGDLLSFLNDKTKYQRPSEEGLSSFSQYS